jgi:Kef-type K+ transport system membrane component KefB
MLGAAVLDDILVVFGLAVFAALVQPDSNTGFLSIVAILVRMVLFLGIAGGLGYWILPRLSSKIARLEISAGLVSFALVVLLFYAFAAEAVGSMAAITGAFLAGLVLGRSTQRERIMSSISSLSYGIFVPIFFVNVGLAADARALVGPGFWLFAGMLLVAIAGKVLGSGLGALLAGFSRREALQLGVGMMSRGEVGLIVASVGIARGWMDQNEFAAVVGVVVVTTLLTPPMLRSLFKKGDAKPQSGSLSMEGG